MTRDDTKSDGEHADAAMEIEETFPTRYSNPVPSQRDSKLELNADDINYLH